MKKLKELIYNKQEFKLGDSVYVIYNTKLGDLKVSKSPHIIREINVKITDERVDYLYTTIPMNGGKTSYGFRLFHLKYKALEYVGEYNKKLKENNLGNDDRLQQIVKEDRERYATLNAY